MPPKRLATLFDQARKYQQLECSYHNNEPAMTLLSDHSCKRGPFPTVSTHVLSEHTDEVWVLEWSHDGRFLATGGRDGQVVIWEVGVSFTIPFQFAQALMSCSPHLFESAKRSLLYPATRIRSAPSHIHRMTAVSS